MNTNNGSIVQKILICEGGLSDHCQDRGGITKYGITAQTLGNWKKIEGPASSEDIKNLTENEAKEIYIQLYILGPNFHKIENFNLRHLVVDSAVHHGKERALKWLQEASDIQKLREEKDFDCLNKKNPLAIYKKFLSTRIKFLGNIISNNPKQSVFAKGWIGRCCNFLENI